MSSRPDVGRRWRRGVLAGALTAGAALLLLGRPAGPAPSGEPQIIGSDSAPDVAAVGMCALNRDSGLLEGRIEEIATATGGAAWRYRVRPLDNAAAEYLLHSTAVQVVRCP